MAKISADQYCLCVNNDHIHHSYLLFDTPVTGPAITGCTCPVSYLDMLSCQTKLVRVQKADILTTALIKTCHNEQLTHHDWQDTRCGVIIRPNSWQPYLVLRFLTCCIPVLLNVYVKYRYACIYMAIGHYFIMIFLACTTNKIVQTTVLINRLHVYLCSHRLL